MCLNNTHHFLQQAWYKRYPHHDDHWNRWGTLIQQANDKLYIGDSPQVPQTKLNMKHIQRYSVERYHLEYQTSQYSISAS